jgi:hypothetical protein
MFEPPSDNGFLSRNEDAVILDKEEDNKASSAPEISEKSEGSGPIEERHVRLSAGERVAYYMRRYSPLSYQLCGYLENEEETKYLSAKQRQLIRHYLLVHVL